MNSSCDGRTPMDSETRIRGTRQAALRSFYRARALVRWGRLSFSGIPVVFGNAMPKSGSHLLLQILQGLARIGPFVEPGGEPLRTITASGRTRPPEEILVDLRNLQPGDVTLGYLWATPENLAVLSQPRWATYFVLRDPRDMLISHLHYATEMYPGHGMHDYYTRLPDMSERLKAAIRGVDEDGARMAGVAARYERWVGFLEVPEVMVLHFEDLITNRDGKLSEMLDHLETAGYTTPIGRKEAIRRLSDSVDPSQSPTFRKGKSGEWRQHFGDEHKDLFKELTGDLLIRLGYEKDQDW